MAGRCGATRSRSASSASTSAAQSSATVGRRVEPSRHRAAHQRGPAIHVTAARPRRIGGPHRLDNLVPQRVRVTVGRRWRPVFDHAARLAGVGRAVDDLLELAEELRRSPRLGLGGAPVVTRQQQRVLRAGERHVQQPALLVDAALIEPALVLGDLVRQQLSDRSRRRCRAPGRRGRPAVARSPRSSGGRSPASVSHVRIDAVDGNTRPLRCGTATTCHSRPLAACTVRICTRSCDDGDLGGSQPVLHHHRGIQVGEQIGHRRARPRGRVVGHHIGEGVEVFGAGPPADGGRAARASASTPSTRRTSATRSGSGCARCARSPVNSWPSAVMRRWPSGE